MRISSFNLPPVEALKITRYIKLITDLGEHDSVIPEICGGCELHTPPPQACPCNMIQKCGENQSSMLGLAPAPAKLG
jgi:hypothetical protein